MRPKYFRQSDNKLRKVGFSPWSVISRPCNVLCSQWASPYLTSKCSSDNIYTCLLLRFKIDQEMIHSSPCSASISCNLFTACKSRLTETRNSRVCVYIPCHIHAHMYVYRIPYATSYVITLCTCRVCPIVFIQYIWHGYRMTMATPHTRQWHCELLLFKDITDF